MTHTYSHMTHTCSHTYNTHKLTYNVYSRTLKRQWWVISPHLVHFLHHLYSPVILPPGGHTHPPLPPCSVWENWVLMLQQSCSEPVGVPDVHIIIPTHSKLCYYLFLEICTAPNRASNVEGPVGMREGGQ